MADDKTYWHYVWKSVMWYIGNFLFGVLPILFMGLVFLVSGGKYGSSDIDRLIHDATVLFVCCAMMGGVMVDLLQSDFTWSGRQVFAIFISPLIITALLCIEYLFVVLRIINTDCFGLTSLSTVFVVSFSFLYCLVNRTVQLVFNK